MENKQIVIITDDAAPTQKLAVNIASIIREYQGYSVAIIQAESFSAVELLPVSAFFVGCSEPEPLSFHYIETFFKHINLAGRSCGIFSSDAKGIKYLSMLLHDCETALAKPFLAKDDAEDNAKLNHWVHGIL